LARRSRSVTCRSRSRGVSCEGAERRWSGSGRRHSRFPIRRRRTA
jgi:hypothetical protein